MLFPIIIIFVNASHQKNQTQYRIFRMMVHKTHSALRSGGLKWCHSPQPMLGWHTQHSENPGRSHGQDVATAPLLSWLDSWCCAALGRQKGIPGRAPVLNTNLTSILLSNPRSRRRCIKYALFDTSQLVDLSV